MKPPLNKGPQQNAASCGFDPSQIRNRMERRLQQLDLSPSLAKAGESWSELEDSDSDLEPIMAHHLDSPVSDANSSSQQSATNNGGVMASTANNNNNSSKTLCTRLPIQDIDQFGLYPKNDRFITVICVVCSQVIKACAFAKHMESRHFHVLQRLKRRKTNANKFVTSISTIVGNGCDDLLKLNSEEETSSSISNKSSSVNSSIQAASSSSDLHQLNGKSSISLSSSSSSPIIFDQSSCDFLPSIGTSDGPGSTNNSWDHQPQQSQLLQQQLPLEGVCNSMATNANASLRNTATNNLNIALGDKLNNNNSTNSSYLSQQLPLSPNQVDVGGAGGVPVSDTGIQFSSNGNCIAPSFRVIKGNYGGNKLSCANKVLPVPTVSRPTVNSNTTGASTSASNSLLPMGGSLIDSKRINQDSMELYDSDNSEAIIINSGFTDDEDDEVEESLDNLSKIRMSTDNKYLGFRSNISTNEDIRSNSGFFNNEDPSNYLEIHKPKELGATISSQHTDPSTKIPSAISRKTINRMKVVPGNAVVSTTTTTTATASVTSSATPAVTTAKKSVCSKMVAIISKNPNATPIIVHSGTMLQSQSQLTTPNTPTITTPNLTNQVPTPTSSTSSSISTPTVAVSSSSVSTPAASSIPKKKLVLCKDRLYDPDQHCGVFQTGMDRPCTRTLTCRSHIVSLRRAVAGRSKPFDELLTEYKRVRGFKDRQPGSRRKTPSLSDTKNTPTTTPQQTPTATKAAAAKSQQSMSSNEKSLLVDDEVILFQEFIRQSPVGVQDSSGTIIQATPKRNHNKSQTSKNSDDLQSEEDVLFTFNMYDDKSASHHHNSQQSSSHFHPHPHQNHHQHQHQIATTSRAYPRPASTSTVELNNFEHLFITNLSETTTTTSNHHNRSNCKNPLIEDLEDRNDDLLEGYSNSLEFPDVLSNIPSLDSVEGKTVDESPSNQFHIRYQLPTTVSAKAKQRARPAAPPQQSQEPQPQQHGQQHDNNSLLSNNNYNTKLINTNQLLPVGNSMYTIVPHNDSLPKKAIAEVPSSQSTSSSVFSSLLLASYSEPANQSSTSTSTSSQVYQQQRPTVNNNTSQNYDTFSSNPNSLLLQDSTTSTISIQEKPERAQSHQSTSLLLSNNNSSNNRSVYQRQQNPNNLIYQQSIIDSSDSGSGFGNQSTSSSTGFVNNSILLPDSMLNSLAMLSPSSSTTVTVSSATATTNSSKTIEPTTLKNLLNLPTASTTSNSGNIALAMGSDFENQIFDPIASLTATNSTSGLTGDADSMSSSSMMSPVVIHNSSVGNSSENWIIENIKTDLMQSVEDKFRSSSAPLPPAPPPPPPPPLVNNGCNVTTNVVASGNSYEAAAAAAAADDFDISDPAFSQILLQDTANAAASIVPDDIFDLIEDLEKEEMRFSEISDYITVDHQTANNNNNNSNSLMSISSGKLSPGDMDSLKRKIEQSNFKSYSDYGCAMSDTEADPRTSISQPNLLQMQSHHHDKISINSGSSGLGSILSGGSQLNLTESSNSSSIKSKEFEQKPKFVTILNGSFDSINRDGTTGNASLQILNNVISNSGLRLQRSQRTYLKNSENSSNDNSNSQQQKSGNILMPITVSGSIVSSGNSPAHQTQQQQMQSQISSPNNNNKSSAAAGPSSAPSTPTSNPYQLQFPMPAFLLPSLSHIRQVPTNVYILQPSDIANSNSGGGGGGGGGGSTATTSDSILSGTVPAASSTVVSSGSSLLSSASSSSANSSGSTHLSSAGTASSSSPASSILRIHPQNIRFIPPPNKKHKSE